MLAKAVARYVRMTPRKVGYVISPLRKRTVSDALALLSVACTAAASESAPCRGPGAHVEVDTARATLHLCNGSALVASFTVALARNGTGKTARGDLKTPLGKYALGRPRASAKFGTFIPIGYPTEAQKKQGLTGADVGIHGPHRRLEWLGSMNAWLDWTQGCVAVATDEEIGAIARWVDAAKATWVRLR